MRNYFVCLLILSLSSVAFATVFKPLSIKKHLQESSGVIEGEVISMTSEFDENNKIITRVKVKAQKWIGDYYIEDQEVSLYYPGGQVGKKGRFIEGSPKFSIGEKVVLLTKQANDYQWISNLGLGKYSVKRLGSEEIIVNQIFPKEPTMGQMLLKDFYQIASDIKQKKFQHRFKEKYEVYHKEETVKPNPNQPFVGRKIASIQTDESQKASRLSPGWLVFLLALLGVAVGVLRIKRS